MKFIKKKTVRIFSLILCGVLIFGAVGAVSFASGAGKNQKEETKASANGAVSGEMTAASEEALSEDETVYVIADADGTARKIIVSDWIREAGGKDIYDQEEIEKELPVDISISYQLDGKEISAEDLAGKSGTVKMRFDYTNKQYIEREINGEKEKIYVPFVTLTGMIVDNEQFKNVEISNGRIINDGDHTIMIGLAMPGLQEDLKLDREKMEFPDWVEITADVTDFELAATMTLATSEIFSEIDLENVDTFDGLKESLGQLTDAMDQLMDGSSALYDGLSTLLEKSGDLTCGIGELKAGAGKLTEGAGKLSDGAEALHSGSEDLSKGLTELAENNDALNGGAKQVFDSLLRTAGEQLLAAGISVPELTVENYAQVLESVIGSLDENTVRELAKSKALETVTAKVRENTVAVNAQVEAAIREQVLAGVLQAAGNPMSAEQYHAIMDGAQVDEQIKTTAVEISEAVDAQMNSEEIKASISQTTEAKLQELINQNMQSDEVASQINAAVESARNGAAGISALKQQLDSYNQFYQGLLSYTSGVVSAKDGAAQVAAGAAWISSGAEELSDGAGTLQEGIEKLDSGSGMLIDGVSQLKDGAMQLSDGLKEFNEEGIEKLADAVEGDLEGLIERVRATVKAAKEYRSFKGISEGMNGKVKFIYKTDAIETE